MNKSMVELMRKASAKLESRVSFPDPLDTWEDEGGACLLYREAPSPTKITHKDPYTIEFEKSHSKCCFCGATNGKYGSVLQQHRPRCRWMGDADKFVAMHPNYDKMIEEDDSRYLPMMRAQSELETCKRELTKLKKPAEKSNG